MGIGGIIVGWVLVGLGVVSLIGMFGLGIGGGRGGSAGVLFVVFVVAFGLGSVMVGLPVPWAPWADSLAFRSLH